MKAPGCGITCAARLAVRRLASISTTWGEAGARQAKETAYDSPRLSAAKPQLISLSSKAAT